VLLGTCQNPQSARRRNDLLAAAHAVEETDDRSDLVTLPVNSSGSAAAGRSQLDGASKPSTRAVEHLHSFVMPLRIDGVSLLARSAAGRRLVRIRARWLRSQLDAALAPWGRSVERP
jgi:hypothetical protein